MDNEAKRWVVDNTISHPIYRGAVSVRKGINRVPDYVLKQYSNITFVYSEEL